ncbi:hypothetical protein [uncultured Paludibaculum sp.]|uniref:hypothetical protein n=1 Tax=uncultured Paludibaculum sp. TaxID=1765020 RepID=UPI002AAAF438|nr:hypothetical protein [uncultured Paludibaculum sp.]
MTPSTPIVGYEMQAGMANVVARGMSPDCEWRLPSGEDLISFALATGFAAGPLLPGPVEQVIEQPTELLRHGRQRRRM